MVDLNQNSIAQRMQAGHHWRSNVIALGPTRCPLLSQLCILCIASVFLMSCQSVSLNQLAEQAAVAGSSADLATEPTLPLAPEEATPPTNMAIADLGLTLDVVPMGWVVTEANSQPTTEWIVPTDAVGWHANSVGAGAAGNLILSGHQIIGDAVFAPLALGDIMVGQEIALTDADGATYSYEIVEVSEPVPILGATPEDENMARSFLQPSESAILTMMTGWPDFTTTHRIFAVAELVVPGDTE